MGKRLTTKEFIERATKIHGNKYNYDKVKYVNSKIKVKIKCNRCGKIFEQTPDAHINQKSGCPYCADRIKVTKEKFIERATKFSFFTKLII